MQADLSHLQANPWQSTSKTGGLSFDTCEFLALRLVLACSWLRFSCRNWRRTDLSMTSIKAHRFSSSWRYRSYFLRDSFEPVLPLVFQFFCQPLLLSHSCGKMFCTKCLKCVSDTGCLSSIFDLKNTGGDVLYPELSTLKLLSYKDYCDDTRPSPSNSIYFYSLSLDTHVFICWDHDRSFYHALCQNLQGFSKCLSQPYVHWQKVCEPECNIPSAGLQENVHIHEATSPRTSPTGSPTVIMSINPRPSQLSNVSIAIQSKALWRVETERKDEEIRQRMRKGKYILFL